MRLPCRLAYGCACVHVSCLVGACHWLLHASCLFGACAWLFLLVLRWVRHALDVCMRALVACGLHAFGCSCSGVGMRLCACFVHVLCILGFCMLPACFRHAFAMPTGVCVRLCACFVLGWCMSLASACFLLVSCMRLAVSACAALAWEHP